jgi:hypothetical protein
LTRIRKISPTGKSVGETIAVSGAWPPSGPAFHLRAACEKITRHREPGAVQRAAHFDGRTINRDSSWRRDSKPW